MHPAAPLPLILGLVLSGLSFPFATYLLAMLLTSRHLLRDPKHITRVRVSIVMLSLLIFTSFLIRGTYFLITYV